MTSNLTEIFQEFFTNQNQPFCIIFDKLGSFKHFFENLKFKDSDILIIKSTKNPSEILPRKNQINQFAL